MKISKVVTSLLIFSFFLLVVWGGSSRGDSPQVVAVTENVTGPVHLNQNDLMTLSLRGKGSSGYYWAVRSGTGIILTQVGDAVYSAEDDANGIGGTHTFTFKATTPGATTLHMIFHEPGVHPLARAFRVTVIVGS